jgi:hypothetical protein
MYRRKQAKHNLPKKTVVDMTGTLEAIKTSNMRADFFNVRHHEMNRNLYRRMPYRTERLRGSSLALMAWIILRRHCCLSALDSGTSSYNKIK